MTSQFDHGTDSRDPVESLLCIAKSFRALYGLKLAAAGLFNGQDELLLVLDDLGKTTTRVADALSIRPATVSKMTDRLIDGGFVTRSGDRADGRRTIIKITPEGTVLREQVLKARHEMNAELVRWAERAGTGLDGLEAIADLLAFHLRRHR